MILESPRSLAEVCRTRAQQHPDQTAYTFLVDGETQEQTLTYGEFDTRARALAARLQSLNTDGDRALLLYEPGLDFAVSFFACLYAGVLPVPAYPPDPMRLERSMPRLRAIVDDAQASIVLGDAMNLRWGDVLLDGLASVQHVINTSEVPSHEADRWRPVRRGLNDLAFLQYTSGSTGQPKGVMISNRAILYQVEQMMEWDVEGAVGVHWLPTYHDLGLVAGVLLPMYASVPTISMSPFSFVQRPLRWLSALSRYGGTTTGGPNFAFDLCVRKIKDEECEGLDLSRWAHALNGGEPIRAATLKAFTEKFRPYGLRENMFRPSYGMAETTLGVSGNRNELPRTKHVVAADLETHHRVVEAVASDATRELVACGRPLPDTTIEIVDPQTFQTLRPGEVGEIWVQSPSVADGYWNREAETERTFRATIANDRMRRDFNSGAVPTSRFAGPQNGCRHFLRTGDLGFLQEGQLYITGRIKDLIIIGGRNHYPQDIEQTVVDSHEALKIDSGAAFSVDVDGSEQLVVVQEVQRPNRYDLDEITYGIREQILERHEISPHSIVLIKAGKIPKTTSGKIQRRQCRQDFLEGRLTVVAQWSSRPEAADAGRAVRFVAPRNALEKQLAAIWVDVLGLDRVGVKDNFFDLGGQSIQATLMASRIRTQFQIDVPLGRVFADPTIANLAQVISDLRDSAKQVNAPSAGSDLAHWNPTATDSVLSVQQEQLWVVEQLAGDSSSHNVYATIQITGILDQHRLAQAVEALALRHPVLRTTFPTEKGLPRPTMLDAGAINVLQWHAGERDDIVTEAELSRIIRGEKQRRFDLQTAAPFHLAVVPSGVDRWTLVMVLHHLVADGWSLGVIARDLAALYAAESLTSTPISFEHYAGWQRHQINSGAWDHHLCYWEDQLKNFRLREIPTDKERGLGTPFIGEQLTFSISRPLAAKVDRLCRDLELTPFAALITAAQATVSHATGTTDVCVGTPVAGRTCAELEDAVGMFVNTLPIRSRWSAKSTFADLLERAKQTTIEALTHQDAPLATIVERIAPARSTANPLFQVLFVLQNLPHLDALNSRLSAEVDGQELIAQPLEAGSGGSGLDLSLEVRRQADGYAAQIEYNAALFHRETVERFSEQFIDLLEAMTSDPNQLVVNALSDSNGATVLGDDSPPTPSIVLGPSRDDFLASPPFIGMFERVAERTPNAIATRAGETTLTYRQLNNRAEALAVQLRQQDVSVGSVIGVCLPRSVEMVVSLLAVQKCGGAYLPLDPNYPVKRLQFLCNDADVELVIVDADETAGKFAESHNVLSLEQHTSADLTTAANEHAAPGDDSVAYIIYTSGSSGTPKGVLVEQGGWRNSLLGLAAILDVDGDCTVVQSSSPNFDGSMAEIGVALATGATLVLPLEHEDLCDVMRRERVSHCFLPPTAWSVMAPSSFPDLDVAISVGEACPQTVAQQWSAGRRFFNGYGPTECTISATLAQCDGAVTPPIGKPLPNTAALVLSPDAATPGAPLSLVPQGETGELYLVGAGVARGYLQRSELSTERFFDHPPIAGENLSSLARVVPTLRCYRTGDRVRVRPDGQLEFIGRVDHQVKVRGFRIELGEIEEAARQHPLVQQAAAVVQKHEEEPGALRQQLALYVAAGKHRDSVTQQQLREHLETLLPNHSLPHAIVVQSELPLNNVGKIDRRELERRQPTPARSVGAANSTMAMPRTEREKSLADIWARLLRVESVGIHDNFFELGGDSILAIQVASQTQQAGIAITPRQMFQFQTIAELASVADVARQIQSEQGELAGELDPLPIQQWFFAQRLAEADAFQQTVSLELDEPVDPGLLRVALIELVRYHDALRLRQDRESGRIRYAEANDNDVFLLNRRIDGAVSEVNEQLRRAQRDVQQAIDLSRGPLLAAGLCDTPSGQHLFLAAHHLSVDGVSWRILLEDLLLAMEQLRARGTVTWPMKTTSLRQWSARLDQWRQAVDLHQQRAFWHKTVAKMSTLPRDRQGANLVASERTIHGALSQHRTRMLPLVNQAFRSQTSDLLLAALWSAQRGWDEAAETERSSTRPFSLHVESHGREPLFDDVDLSRTIGWFTSMHPMVLQMESPQSSDDAEDLLHRLRAARRCRQQVPDGGLGYGLLRWSEGLEALEAPVEMAFNFLGNLDAAVPDAAPARIGDGGARLRSADTNRRPAVLDLNAYILDGKLQWEWHYSENLHDAATIERLDEELQAALDTLIELGVQDDRAFATPEDFPLVRLDQTAVDRLLSHRHIENVLPVSALQAGMIFRASQPGIDPNVHQATCDLVGQLQRDAFEAAWLAVASRHQTLRSSFHWEDLPEPVQVIHNDVSLPLNWVDASTWSSQQIDCWLKQEIELEFDWKTPPLMRVTVLQISENRWKVVWTHHHILSDGWSMPLILKEVMLHYESRISDNPAQLPPAPRIEELVKWKSAQNWDQAEAFWREELQGFTRPSRMADSQISSGPSLQTQRQIPAESIANVAHFCRENQLTLNTAVQVSWALAVAKHAKCRDVMFGATVSGRTAPVANIDAMVGMLINVLPVRVQLRPGQTLHQVLATLQRRQADAREYEHTPPSLVQRCCDSDLCGPLFDHLLVVENYPLGQASKVGRLTIEDIEIRQQTSLPLTVLVIPGDGLTVRMIYDAHEFAADDIESLMSDFVEGLGNLPKGGDRTISELAPWLAGPSLPTDDHRPAERPRTPATPTNDTEALLLEIWQDTLDVDDIGIDDNLSDLGGFSLQALGIVAKAQDAHLPLQPQHLFLYPTVRQLAAALETIEASSAPALLSAVAPLKTDGEGPPLFLVHPAGGNAFPYIELATQVDDRLGPIYGIQANGLVTSAPPDTTVRAMADRYTALIEKTAPQGPVQVGGWSLGGLIAYEVARRLSQAGREVAPVLILDISPAPAELQDDQALRELQQWLPGANPMSLDQWESLSRRGRTSHFAEQLQRTGMMADFAAEEIARRMLGVLEASKSAAAKYQAPSSDLQVLLIQSRATKEDLASQWQRVVGGRVIQETVGGNHLTMMQGEHLLQVARAISKHLTSPR